MLTNFKKTAGHATGTPRSDDIGYDYRTAFNSWRRALEEEPYWNLQNVGDLLQPARSDAVSTLLVFLHLLEREAERIAQFSLAHCKHHAAHAHPAADVFVDWVR